MTPDNESGREAAQRVCFIVMPYGERDTGVAEPGTPARVDFDALYREALLPAVEACGYVAVRADHELSPLIVVDMLERLTMSDLVLADLTVPNGNVYYEVGVRHATDRYHCVLIAAQWARPLFDLQQIRQGRYPLPAGELTAEHYAAVRRAVEKAICDYADSASPVRQVRDAAQAKPNASVFRDVFEKLARLQAKIRALPFAADDAARSVAVRRMVEDHSDSKGALSTSDGAALELLRAVRDHLGWAETLAYIAKLPARLGKLAYVREQKSLAQSKTGDDAGAIAELEVLIGSHGESSERRGLLGGIFKRLYDASANAGAPKPQLLDKAIEHYERGMLLDLNSYYPGNNLPRLYRLRGADGDLERAVSTSHTVAAACQRALLFTPSDPWLRPTLLGAAFDAADVPLARELSARVRSEGPANWMSATTIKDLERSANLCADAGAKVELLRILEELRASSPAPQG